MVPLIRPVNFANAKIAMILFQHAQSESNVSGLTMPHQAVPLTAKRRLQAEMLAFSFHAEPTRLLVSKMVRAHQKATLFCVRVGVVPREHLGLKKFSVIDAKQIADPDGFQRPLFVHDFWRNRDSRSQWGEKVDTFVGLEERAHNVIDNLDDIGNSIVVFGHGAWLGMLHWLTVGNRTRSVEGIRTPTVISLPRAPAGWSTISWAAPGRSQSWPSGPILSSRCDRGTSQL